MVHSNPPPPPHLSGPTTKKDFFLRLPHVIWIIFEIHVLNLSVKMWGYCILIGLYTLSVRSYENIGQSENSKVALIGSNFNTCPEIAP